MTRILSVALLFTAVYTISAWTTSSTTSSCFSRDSVALFASRKAAKAVRKKAWMEKRGYLSGSADDSAAEGGGDSSGSGFCTVIGGGRIGSLLAQGGESLLLGRGDSIPADGEGAILICTRNDSLDGIVESCPENRRDDLVFLQNGYLDDFLASKNMLDNTQVLLYLSVTALGADAVDGVTTVNPEGLTAATGKHAQAFADRLNALNLKCNVVTPEDYRPAMFEKLIWISTYMLVGTAKECKSVGQAGSDHKDLVESVINELVSAVSAKEGIKFEEGTIPRLAAYTDVVTDFPCGVKEFEWRNQYFYNLKSDSGEEACPIHNGLLRECAEKGFVGFELP